MRELDQMAIERQILEVRAAGEAEFAKDMERRAKKTGLLD
eukprot:SAG25_NODE_12818_length_275_cov_0.573864_1_plen_39_part_01